MGLGNRLSAGAAQPWIAQLRHHVIRARAEPPLSFTARVIAPQLVSYWDYDWVPEWRRRPTTDGSSSVSPSSREDHAASTSRPTSPGARLSSTCRSCHLRSDGRWPIDTMVVAGRRCFSAS